MEINDTLVYSILYNKNFLIEQRNLETGSENPSREPGSPSQNTY
jgi:hypothetical protein